MASPCDAIGRGRPPSTTAPCGRRLYLVARWLRCRRPHVPKPLAHRLLPRLHVKRRGVAVLQNIGCEIMVRAARKARHIAKPAAGQTAAHTSSSWRRARRRPRLRRAVVEQMHVGRLQPAAHANARASLRPTGELPCVERRAEARATLVPVSRTIVYLPDVRAFPRWVLNPKVPAAPESRYHVRRAWYSTARAETGDA